MLKILTVQHLLRTFSHYLDVQIAHRRTYIPISGIIYN